MKDEVEKNTELIQFLDKSNVRLDCKIGFDKKESSLVFSSVKFQHEKIEK